MIDQFKKINSMQALVIVGGILLALLILFTVKSEAAYANILLPHKKNSPAHSSQPKITVTANDLNVRETGGLPSKIIGLVHQGETFRVIEKKDHWDKIILSNHHTGWISNDFVTKAIPNENVKAAVEANVLNVRKHPGLSHQVVGQLKSGTEITVHQEIKGWAKIVSTTGVQGWVDEYYIKKDTSNDQQTHPAKTTQKRGTDEASSRKHNKKVVTQNSQNPLEGKTIVLDPGHGGIDDGTTSIVGTHEKTLTLATAKDVEQKLKNAGAHVIMTRTTDTYISLQKRADLSNQYHADAFISFHYNWSNVPTANGVVDFYYQKSKDKPLASDILNDVVKTTGLHEDGTRKDNLYVLRNNEQPCTLIELGFLSNKQDDAIVESSAYRDQVARGVYKGLVDYFSGRSSK